MKEYPIKIPVYTSKSFSEESGMFGNQSYSDMINTIEEKINTYNKSDVNIQVESKNKSTKTVISKISHSRHQLLERDCLLLRIEAYNTNFNDGFIRSEDEKPLKLKDKIGSHNNCVLIYPMQVGLQTRKIKKYFLVLIYEDPSKNFGQLVKVAKNVAKEVLKTPIKNIKLPELLSELKECRTIPELYITMNTLEQSDEVDVIYREYIVESKLKKVIEEKLENVPFEVVKEILNYNILVKGYKRVIKFINGKKEYKIKEEFNELKNEMDKVVEKVLNSKTIITEDEFENLFETEFILKKMEPVLKNYIMSYSDE